MEDPVAEIPAVIGGFVQNKDSKLQAETVHRFFSNRHLIDFDHELVHDAGDIHNFLKIFKFWGAYNVDIRAVVTDVFYDEADGTLLVSLTQFVRSWWNPFFAHELPMMVHFQLADDPDSPADAASQKTWDQDKPKTKKKIIAQYDYFSVSHGFSNTPVVSSIYPEPWFRNILAKAATVFVGALDVTLMSRLWETALITTKRMTKGVLKES